MKKALILFAFFAVLSCQQEEPIQENPRDPLAGGDFYWTLPNEIPLVSPRQPAGAYDCSNPLFVRVRNVSTADLSWPTPPNLQYGRVVNQRVEFYRYIDLPALNPARRLFNTTVRVGIKNLGTTTVKICPGNNCNPNGAGAAIIPPSFTYYLTLPVIPGSCSNDMAMVNFTYTWYMYHCGFTCSPPGGPAGYYTSLKTYIYTINGNYSPTWDLDWETLNQSPAQQQYQWLNCTGTCPTYPGI